VNVLVAAPRKVDDDRLLGRQLPRELERVRDRVRGFERGDDAFESG